MFSTTLFVLRCILSKFYIKPQPLALRPWDISRCILSKFYIKPQPDEISANDYLVVSYRNSTSNHNSLPTSSLAWRLYLIEILHQTTTLTRARVAESVLYLIEILHQTTTSPSASAHSLSCILSKFYIKPQHCDVLYQWHRGCILSKFYIKPQLRLNRKPMLASCILSKFYIKPQPLYR